MKRNLEQLASTRYDLLVIGGGINGVATAYEAATRGLKTCLLEASDFMSQTSSNSLKIIHGGFRYLQQANFKRIRESSRERRNLLKIAPHLVHPLQCLMPTESVWKLRSLPNMFAASLINGLVSFDRSKGLPPDKRIPLGGIMSKKELIELLGKEFDRPSVTGAAVWHDGMAVNSERLGLAFLHAGVQNGLDAANYCPVTGFTLKNGRISSVQVKDELSGSSFTVKADHVVNAAGAWVGGLLHQLPSLPKRDFPQCRVMNLVTKRQLFPGRMAVGLFDHERAFFFVPWGKYWMIGTDEAAWTDEPGRLQIREEEIERFLGRINKVYPGTPLRREDICHLHKGFVPGRFKPDGDFKLLDHHQEGIANLISILPVKYTTARDVGQKTVDFLLRKLGRAFMESQTADMPLEGGDMESFSVFCAENTECLMDETGISEQAARHLLRNYGSSYRQVLRYSNLLRPLPSSEEILLAEIAYAVDEEMAVHLDDVVRRRTDLGAGEKPLPETLACCAALMGNMLGWTAEQQQHEIVRCEKFYL
ncbi:FAD-dependent oxidoreductase [Candidatus Electronema sp. TJ]|uniref:glycerol-3-phosphate dehydrogenase/oxidase n=1 Tax=Candidatus Electronema sp. TJ TaxID=3401573 RepID=UPI003AA9769F